ncbi:hypothetical protein E2562_031974 [Oryza meyeriana var. granulata]|uniref:Uncharacterized protein n=1 Tax=Oryza meyeriana var. granulata TaxID=110450 RepID=A0A6G1F084_9ORYZ|nr:hypothetical protein E2562_031974 [Oryza meyeriana var. granulata]
MPDALLQDIGKGKQEGATIDNMDPSCPFLVLKKFDWAKSMEMVRDAFFDISYRLFFIVTKDSVRCFLHLFTESTKTFTYKCPMWRFLRVSHLFLRNLGFALRKNTLTP